MRGYVCLGVSGENGGGRIPTIFALGVLVWAVAVGSLKRAGMSIKMSPGRDEVSPPFNIETEPINGNLELFRLTISGKLSQVNGANKIPSSTRSKRENIGEKGSTELLLRV